MEITPYKPQYENAVIYLWKVCNLTRPWNNPKLDIERMLKVYPDLFLVGMEDNKIVATVMGGYDGHRGWIYYLGVLPEYRRHGYARKMMDAVEEELRNIGCPKINIQIRADNAQALGFYFKKGYIEEKIVSIAKRLVED